LNGWDLNDCSCYFQKVENLINTEEDLFNDILEGNNSLRFIGEALKQLLYEKLLDNYRNTFVTSELGIKYFIINKDYESLKRMTNLYSKYDNKYDIIKEGYRDVLININLSHIDELKNQILQENDEMKKNELRKKSNIIEKLILVFIEHNKIIKECFGGHYDFKVMLNKSLETCLNIKKKPVYGIFIYTHTLTYMCVRHAT